MPEQHISEPRWVTATPYWLGAFGLEEPNVVVVPAKFYDRLRTTLEGVATALPVLQRMCKVAGLQLGEHKACEMQEWIAQALKDTAAGKGDGSSVNG